MGQCADTCDRCAMDVIRSKRDGKEYILEINPSSIGLMPHHAKEDAERIRELVLQRMEETFTARERVPSSPRGGGAPVCANTPPEVSVCTCTLSSLLSHLCWCEGAGGSRA